MSDQPQMIMPTDAEQMAKRYLIAKGYYHDKESIPTREVYAMDLINTQPLPAYIVDQNKINNSLDILSDKKETVSDEES